MSGVSTGILRHLAGGQQAVGPVEWAERRGITLWSRQREIADALVHNRRVAVQSAHSCGKSYLAGMLAAWWVDTHPPGEALVITTAPSHPQVHGVLWHEIRQLHDRLNLPGDVQQTDVWKVGGQQVALGRRPHDYSEDSFQGFHRRYVLVILDEAAGIPSWLWVAAVAVTTNEHCRILAIGNPTAPSSEFARMCRPDSGWHTVRVSAFDTPAFTGEVVPARLAELLVSPTWVEDRRRQWGEDSPLWISRVLGRFPSVDKFSVIQLSWVEAANARWRDWLDAGRPEQKGPDALPVLGVDPARFGPDDTVVALRTGNVVQSLERWHGLDTTEVADRVRNRLALPGSSANIDVIGLGAGVYDQLRREGAAVEAFNASAGTTMRDASDMWGFPNTRSASWWHLRELLDPSNGGSLALPDDDLLTGDLIAPTWRELAGGKLQVESKDDIRKRLGRSTDAADAVAMACWHHRGDADAVSTEPGNSVFPWRVDAAAWAGTTYSGDDDDELDLRYPFELVDSLPGDDEWGWP